MTRERLPLKTRLFLAGKKQPLYLAEPSPDVLSDAVATGVPFSVTTTDGEVTHVNPDACQSWGVPGSKIEQVERASLDGKRFTIRMEGQQIVVTGEDLGEAEILRYRQGQAITGIDYDPKYVPPEAVERWVRAIHLIQEAETLIEAQTEATSFNPGQHPKPDQSGRWTGQAAFTDEQRAVMDKLDEGDLAGAIQLDYDYTITYLASLVGQGDRVTITLKDGAGNWLIERIDNYTDPEPDIVLGLVQPDGVGQATCGIDRIGRIVSIVDPTTVSAS